MKDLSIKSEGEEVSKSSVSRAKALSSLSKRVQAAGNHSAEKPREASLRSSESAREMFKKVKKAGIALPGKPSEYAFYKLKNTDQVNKGHGPSSWVWMLVRINDVMDGIKVGSDLPASSFSGSSVTWTRDPGTKTYHIEPVMKEEFDMGALKEYVRKVFGSLDFGLEVKGEKGLIVRFGDESDYMKGIKRMRTRGEWTKKSFSSIENDDERTLEIVLS